jgi:hypothetical protein
MSSHEEPKLGSWRRRAAIGVLLLLGAGLGVAGWLGLAASKAVAYEGRPVDAWFAEFVTASRTGGNSSYSLYGLDVTDKRVLAFAAMEGDAVPFLARKASASPTRKAYTWVFPRLPKRLQARLPPPGPDPRPYALYLLAQIGREQNRKLFEGHPSEKASIRVALPAIRSAMHDPGLRYPSVLAVEMAGPMAVRAVPDLVALIATEYDTHSLQATNASDLFSAIASVGPGAAAAVPLLHRIAADPAQSRSVRLSASQALGGIGRAARPAAPALCALLVEDGVEQGLSRELIALARIGGVTDEALPVVRDIARGTAPLAREYATVAMWEREPDNPEWRDHINGLLLAAAGPAHRGADDPNFLAGPVLASLACHGTNAAIFAPAFKRLLDPRFPDAANLTNLARRALGSAEWRTKNAE